MYTPESLLFRLPQTLIRGLGIIDFQSLRFLQANIVRRENHRIGTDPVEQEIMVLNSEIIHSINDNAKIDVVDLYDENTKVPDKTILDFNLIHFLQVNKKIKLKNFAVLPYASEVYNPSYNELLHVNDLYWCLKKSMYIKKSLTPSYIYDWSSMISKSKNLRYIPWFWKAIPMDIELYLSQIQKVAKALSQKYNFLKLFTESKNPILVQYTESINGQSVDKLLTYLFESNSDFRNHLLNKDSAIFVKPHRSSLFQADKSTSLFMGRELHFASQLIEHYIPSEIFINSALNDSMVISEWSSAIFNYKCKNLIPILNTQDHLIRNLSLAGKRLEQNCGFNPYDIFNLNKD
jgi:hypothetical protein